MSKEIVTPGCLPLDCQLRLKAAAKVGLPGSFARQRAIDSAYQYVEFNYPQYLRRT